jgi:hypothetical protein
MRCLISVKNKPGWKMGIRYIKNIIICGKIKASSHSLLGGFNLNLITIGRQEARHMKPLI